MTEYPAGLSPLTISLFEKAVCEAGTHAEAASSLIAAAAYVLTLRFGAAEAARIMVEVTAASAALSQPAGQA